MKTKPVIKLNETTDLEHRIIGQLMDDLLEEGFTLKTEMDGSAQWILVYDESKPARDNEANHFVKLVRGNGASVISDYSVGLEKSIGSALALADLYE